MTTLDSALSLTGLRLAQKKKTSKELTVTNRWAVHLDNLCLESDFRKYPILMYLLQRRRKITTSTVPGLGNLASKPPPGWLGKHQEWNRAMDKQNGSQNIFSSRSFTLKAGSPEASGNPNKRVLPPKQSGLSLGDVPENQKKSLSSSNESSFHFLEPILVLFQFTVALRFIFTFKAI